MQNQTLLAFYPNLETETPLSKKHLFHQELNISLVKELAQEIDLVFEEDNARAYESNVCLLNSEEVVSAYRTSFNKSDLINYLFACLKNGKNPMEITIPKTSEEFWGLAEKGKLLE